jgi:hypothetical protein
MSKTLEGFWSDFKTQQEEQNSQTKERDSRYGYVILKHNNINDLELDVVKFMKGGWKPIGGVALLSKGSTVFYFQSMMKT